MALKIWFRTNKKCLSHSRTTFGMPISHDETIEAFNRMGIECFPEYPTGNAFNAISQTPEKAEDYLTIWYGDPALFEIDLNNRGRGLVAYCRGGEMRFSGNAYENLVKFDVIFVASSSAREYHRSHPRLLNVPIYVLSGGYKPSLFHLINRDFSASPFVFTHIGAEWRKGTDIACQAFVNAFPSETDTQLLILTPGETEMFTALREHYRNDKRIIFRVKSVSERDKMLSEYYSAGHCLVYPSILEGWGRCLTEAMASGMPCIVTHASAMLDQFNSDCGWWIKMSNDYEGEFLLPDADDLALKMRTAYEHRHLCHRKGRHAASVAMENLTWDVGINRILPILKAIYSNQEKNSLIREGR